MVRLSATDCRDRARTVTVHKGLKEEAEFEIKVEQLILYLVEVYDDIAEGNVGIFDNRKK